MYRFRFAHANAVLLTSALAAITGCSDMTAQVGGGVFLDDKLMEITKSQRGMVVFRPIAGGATCTGLVAADGSYQIATGSSAALVPGEYLVSVRVMELVDPEGENEAPSGRPITPAVYGDPLTSGLTCKVSSGANTYDIKLNSSAGPAVIPLEVEEVVADESGESQVPPPDGTEEEDPTDDLKVSKDATSSESGGASDGP